MLYSHRHLGSLSLHRYFLIAYYRPDNLLKAKDIKMSKIRLLLESMRNYACVLVQATLTEYQSLGPYKQQNVSLTVVGGSPRLW